MSAREQKGQTSFSHLGCVCVCVEGVMVDSLLIGLVGVSRDTEGCPTAPLPLPLQACLPASEEIIRLAHSPSDCS